ncbi:protoheme IX farnesyltransferase [Candidatus Saccharibacteria bacterium]|nr:protoheme IX farnesyltransferase [Candidatus Saccharibacteria bacterium]
MKPGIIRGNAIHVIAGSLFASQLPLQWTTIAAVLVGTCLVIASACVANNYMDRGIDAKMKRTKSRPSVTGEVSLVSAMIFTGLLLVAGFVLLVVFTNAWVVGIGAAAYILYVFVYGWAKRTTIHSTLVGAIPGALPVMAGHVAIVGEPTVGSWLLFLVVFTWQMPHFYAISIFRKKEYKAAHIPVLGVVKSFSIVRAHIAVYMAAYLASITALISLNVIGAPAGTLLLIGAAAWFIVYARTSIADEVKWARAVFATSLILALLLLVASVINVFMAPFV